MAVAPPFPHPFQLEANQNSKLRVLVRPVEHWAFARVGKFLGDIFFHVGIEDVELGCVYHVSDPVGTNTNDSVDIRNMTTTFQRTTKELFRGSDENAVIYYHHPNLNFQQEQEALQRARLAAQRNLSIPYNAVTINCQTVLLDIIFPDQKSLEHQAHHLVESSISRGFDALLSSISFDEKTIGKAENLEQFLGSIRTSFLESMKAASFSAGGAFIGGMLFGPAGALVGGGTAAAVAYYTSKDYDGLVILTTKQLGRMTADQRNFFLRTLKIQSIKYGRKFMRDLALQHRESFVKTLKQLQQ